MNDTAVSRESIGSFLAVMLVGAAAGLLVLLGPLAGIGVGAAVALLTLGAVARGALGAVCVGLVGFGLAGYLFLGRGFAYLAVGSVYVGELLLVACVCGAALAATRAGSLGSVTIRLYLVFAAWGAFVLARDPQGDLLVAIRDSALWYYGLFMLAASILFATPARIELAVRWLVTLLPWLMLWIPVAFALQEAAPELIPRVPGTDVPLLVFKGGDMAVILAVAIVYILACRGTGSPVLHLAWPAWALWTLAVVDFVVIASKNRGGMVCVVAAVLLALVLMPNLRILQGVAIAAACASVLLLAQADVRLDGRDVSVAQVATNALSVVDPTSGRSDGLAATTGWRLDFWRDIIDDTVRGGRFWTGNGFGINLADHYGYQVHADGSLRSPHNATMTVLARMGVPGLVLWTSVQLAYVASMLGGFLQARRARDRAWAAVFVLLLAHWTAANVNASFDPYLEGPQGAIVFWTVLGVGLAARRVYAARAMRIAPARIPGPSPHARSTQPLS